MATEPMLDTEGKALKVGAMYCCVSPRNGYVSVRETHLTDAIA